MNEERFKIVVCGFSQLPPEVDRNDLSENGVGSEDASYLLVYLDGKLLRCESSAMEPEDISFYRDLRWVSQAIIEAWEAALGLRDVPQGQDAVIGRTPNDYAIEHGGYLATAAENFQNAINECARLVVEGDPDRDEELIDAARETRTDAWKSLSSAIYEFRKRAQKAARQVPVGPEGKK